MNQHIVKMRNLLIIVLSVVMLTAFAQQPKDADVPEVVQKSFNKKFPRAQNVSWDKVDDNYKVDCIFRGRISYAEFTPKGEWVQTVVDKDPKSLYPPVAKYVNEHFKKDKVILAEKATRADKQDYYYVQVGKKIKGQKNLAIFELFFDKTGRLQKINKPEGLEDMTIPGIDEPNTDIPAKVISAWQKRFPKASGVKWTTNPHPNDTVDVAYIASFVYRDRETKAEFYPDGKWIETRAKYEEKDLYAPVVKYIYENHYDDELIIAEKVTRYDRKDYYYAKLAQKSSFRPVIFELFFNKSGKIQKVIRPEHLKNEYLLTVDIPELVARKFKSRFSSAKDVKWETDKGNWVASFTYRYMPTTAIFTDSAQWVQTITELDIKKLYSPVQRTLDREYSDYRVTYAEKATRKDRNDYYYVELIARKKNITPQQLGLYFDKTGKLKEDK